MKHIVIIGDGMADYPLQKLAGRTPLMAAYKPAIDRIARLGRCGQLITVEPEMPPGSEVANLTVLGYDPRTCYQGRGVLEAASLGIQIKSSDVAMRCNLICVQDGRIKNHSAGHISTAEAKELLAAVQQALGSDAVHFFPGLSYRHLLVLAHGSPAIECFPPHDHVGAEMINIMIRPRRPDAAPTAALLNDLILRSHDILASHPVNAARRAAGKDEANFIWPWSPGRKPRMKSFMELYGVSGAVISAVDLINGVGVYAGLDVISVPGATGLWDTNYEGKADAAVAALADHDFVYCHVEATDEAGHAKDLELKIKTIEYLDGRLVARIMNQLEERQIEAVVAVLPDHATPVEFGNHVKDPVPVAIFDPRLAGDRVQNYDEESVKAGSLGLMRGSEFIRTVLGAR